jgi:serine/threonine-protein kinase
MAADADRHLLFGLLALQNGLIDQVQLVAAFQAWTRDKARQLADHLVARGDLDAEQRAGVEAMVALHLKKHGGDTERSLAAIPAGHSIREGLGCIADPAVGGILVHLGSASTQHGDAADRTASYAVGEATSDGQRFRVLRPHAGGGLGAVFVALDSELHREVALKQILDHYADDPVSRARFLLEAEVTGGLEHPGVVPVYGLGTYADGRPFYAMRFIRGDSLKQAIARFHADEGLRADAGHRSLELRKLLRRFVDVCNAIDYAHSRGVLHRDIKPANVIVGNYGETLVVDWGLAKATGKSHPSAGERTLLPGSAGGSSETLPGSALGTPAYMSPEQAEGDLDRVGPRSDVYSLGATLYCLLIGAAPFAGDAAEVIPRVRRGDFPPPRAIDAATDRALEAVCLKAMARKPEDRYGSCRAMAEDIERWMADEPVSAWREPLSRRARRWARGHRPLVTGAAATLMAALVGTAAVLAVQAEANARLKAANTDLAIANDQVRQANLDLQSANERETARFNLALEAIRRYHTGVSEDFLLRQDQFKDLRDRLFRDAVAFYRRLEGLLADQADVRSRRALARAYEEVGELTAQIGSVPGALAAHRQALEVRRALAREAAPDPAPRADVGRSLIAIGVLLEKMAQRGEALASLEEARFVLGELGDSGSGPDRDAIRGQIARSYYWTGHIRHRGGQPREALPAFERGIAIAAELVAAHPDSVEDQRTLSWCHNNIGILRYQDGDMDGALAAFEQSRRIKQKIADDHDDVADNRRDLATGYNNIGHVLQQTGRSEEALTAQESALALRREVANAYPAVALFQSDLANSFNEIGDSLRLLARMGEARASYERALAVLEGLIKANPNVYLNKSRLLQALRGLGATQCADSRTADAEATWRRATAEGETLQSNNGETLYYLACNYALLGGVAGMPSSGLSAAEGSAELDRAMGTLRRAIAAGYAPSDWMRRDPDLDALRSRPDFQLLMMDVAFPADPFAARP